MSFSMIAGLALAAFSTPPPLDGVIHQRTIDHRGTAVQATYHGDVRLSLQDVGGVTAPGRMSVQRCNWTGIVTVTRRLARAGDAEPMATRISSDRVLAGSRAGDCMTGRTAIARDAAKRRPEVEVHLAAVADADRARIPADLMAAERLAAR